MDRSASAGSAEPADVAAEPAGRSPVPWREVLGYVGGPVLAGLVTGLLIGGVGGRLAMLLLRLTSSDALRGVETDDGFVIGKVTTATVGFVLVMGILGVAGGVFYRVVRRWLPDRGRPLIVGALFAVLGLSLIHI